jgi:FMN phosphatase YigB (HAD superfamily)
MFGIENLILDFDGTFTDVTIEAVPMLAKWEELFLKAYPIPKNLFDDVHARIANEIRNDVSGGWIHGGVVVAPACSDAYVFNNAVYNKLIPYFKKEGLIPEELDVDSFMYHELFLKAYPFSSTCFREGAKEFLEEASSRCNIAIVTNSKTVGVEKKLLELGFQGLDIRGDAKKYEVEQDPNKIGELKSSVASFEGFPRQTWVSRMKYLNVLNNLNKERGFGRFSTLVVGDNFELDLALPSAIGYPTAQLVIPETPSYEVEYLKKFNLTKGFSTYPELFERIAEIDRLRC